MPKPLSTLSPSAGTLQSRRALPAQDPATFSVEERGALDWLAVWQDLAGKLRFYAPDGQEQGRWSDLLPPPADWPALAAWLDEGQPLPERLKARAAQPQLALLLAFLRLQRHPRAAFANLTERHRQDYYRRRLALAPRAGQPDEADVLLTLNDGVEAMTLPAGAAFDAGLDAQGKQRVYRSLDDLPLSQAKLAAALTLAQTRAGGQTRLRAARLLDAAAGLDWPAEAQAVMGSMDGARAAPQTLGVRLESPLLAMQAGQRALILTFSGLDAISWLQALGPDKADDTALSAAFNQAWQARAGGVEGPLALPPARLLRNRTPFRLGERDSPSSGEPSLQIVWTLDEGAPALQGADGSAPWLEMTLRADGDALAGDLAVWQGLKWQNAALAVECRGLAPACARNSDGVVDVSAAFDAFPGPVRDGNRLWLAHPEWWNKPLAEIRLDLAWEGRPGNLEQYYQLYRSAVGMAAPTPRARLVASPTSGYLPNAAEPALLSADRESVTFSLSRSGAALPGQPEEWPADPQAWPGWFALEYLGGGFGHAEEAAAANVLAGRYTAALLQWSRQPPVLTSAIGSTNSGWSSQLASPGGGTLPWESGSVGEQQLTLNYNRAFRPASLQLSLADDNRLGKNPCLYGSRDGSTWERLLDLPNLSPKQNVTLPLSVDGSYSRYRLAALPGDIPQSSSIKLQSLSIQEAAAGEPPQPDVLPPPYTPRLSAVRLGYRGQARDGDNLSVWQLHPIGRLPAPLQSKANAGARYTPVADEMGAASALYLGFAQLTSPCQLTLRPELIARDNGDAGLPDPQWKALTPQGWIKLQADKQGQGDEVAAVLSDQSNGLRNSGIVRLQLPALWRDDAGLSWICVQQPPADDAQAAPPAYADLARVAPHAVRVRYQGSDDAHLAAPLPAQSIAALLPPLPQVAEVSQPAASQDGHPGEDDVRFAIRAAERLSHKNRALQARDYERLALDAFPRLALARAERGEGGAVRLVVAPWPDRDGQLQPQPSRQLQTAIAARLSPQMPINASLSVAAPRYRVCRIGCNLVLKPAYEPGAALRALNARLVDFLSPWRGNGEQGQKQYLSAVSRFLCAQAEVTAVVALRSEYLDDAGDWITNYQPWLDCQAQPGLARADLLVPAAQHLFVQLSDSRQLFEGIGVMELEFDFIVAQPRPPILTAPIGQGRVGIDLAVSFLPGQP
nr:baseplate J/gp47 family protein [Chromobacterium sp. ASV5]